MVEVDRWWLLLVGSVVVLVTLADLVVTTLAAGAGRGPLTNAVARAVRWIDRAGAPSHRRLRWTGILGAASVPTMWVMMLWAGFAVVFLADDDAVVDAATQQPTSALGRVAFAAGGLAGAGAGLVAGTEAWQVVNNVSALIGLGAVTLGVTYLFQVVTSVKEERSAAARIAGLGDSPSSIVAVALEGDGMGTLPDQLVSVAETLSSVAQGHRALPLLQFFHSGDRATSMALNLARYDEVLSLLAHAAPGEHRASVATCRSAVDTFLDTLHLPPDTQADPPPPPPALGPLRDATDAIPDDAVFEDRLAGEDDRRRRLRSYVGAELWDWDDVLGR